MIRGMGIPISQSRMGMCVTSVRVYCELADGLAAPGAVAKTSAFSRGQTGTERADQEGCRQPESQLCRRLACRFDIRFGLGYDLVDALVGIGLTEAGSCGDDLCDIFAVGGLEVGSVAEAAGELSGISTCETELAG
jgi:hypothetical protein